MANNSNRVIMATDPNGNGMSMVNTEDLCIIVDLETETHPRTNFVTKKGVGYINDNDSEKLKIRFLEGTEQGNIRNLSTEYTNIGNYRPATTILNTKGEDFEALGITSIDISFNSSFAPLIVINFIDVRGWSILEQGNNSKYKVFFTMPYPIFKLTVKGYFGQAVTYSLHMTKFNAKFNSKTGNFEIKCEFIGHTYAFLTDMLVGYLRAAAETTRGKELLLQKQSKNPSIISITELLTRIGKLNQTLVKIKQDSEIVKGLSSIETKTSKLSDLKKLIEDFKQTIINNIEINGRGNNLIAENYDNLYILRDQLPNNTSIFTYTDKSTQLVKDINSFSDEKSELMTMIKEINTNLDSDLILSVDLYSRFIQFNGTVETFLNSKSAIEDFGPGKYSFLKESLTDSKLSIDTIIVIVDFSVAINDIINKTSLLNDVKDGYMKDISGELKDRVSTDIELRTDIKTIFSILCAHVEIFTELIREVADKTKNDSSRYGKFERYLKSLDINENTTSNKDNGLKSVIYPFPGYEKDGDEAWIGREINGIPETDFIDDLLTGFLKTAEADNILEKSLNGNILNWHPTSILDTKFLIEDNPYVKLRETNKYMDLFDMIMKRCFLSLHYTNTHIKDYEINTIAKLEGLNIIDNVLTKDILKILTKKDIATLLTEYTTHTNNRFVSDKNSDSTASSNFYFYNGNITVDNTTAGRYITGNNLDSNIEYVKILSLNEYKNSGFGEYPNYDYTDTKYTASDEPLNVFTVQNDELYLTPSSAQPNYDILSGKYKIQEFFNITIDGGSNTIQSDAIFWSDVSYGGSKMVNTFGELPNKNSEIIQNRISNKIDFINKSQIGFQTFETSQILLPFAGPPTTYSIFGSEFYFRQFDNLEVSHPSYQTYSDRLKVVNKSKAILFLHSLPFDGLIGKVGYGLLSTETKDNSKGGLKRSLFNKRGGFVKAPKTWVLLIGGLLWRYESVKNKQLLKDPIIFGDKSNSYLLYSSNINHPSTSQYLKASPEKDYYYEPMRFSNQGGYISIEETILNLPESVKSLFINYFNDWTEGINEFSDTVNWLTIKEFYEIEDTSSIIDVSAYKSFLLTRENTFDSVLSATEKYKEYLEYESSYSGLGSRPATLTKVTEITKPILKSSGIYKESIIDRCETITGNFKSDVNVAPKSNYNISYIDTQSDTSDVNDIINHIIEPIVIANYTWRIWGTTNDKQKYTGYYTNNFNINEGILKKYLTQVIKTIDSKIGGETLKKEDENTKKNLFGSIDNDTIKLNLYRTVKAIYDKWIAGSESGSLGILNRESGETTELIDTFRFINKAYQDIGDKFLINPMTIQNELKNNTNQSFYDLISRILVSNNFEFIPMPTFIDFTKEEELKKMFEPITYKDYGSNTNIGPSFVCVYVGQTSKHLDIDDSFPDDSIQFIQDNNTNLSKDFSGEGYTIPVFAVNYAQGNQSIFKDINLDQSEFSETDESLKIIDDIALQGDKMNRTPVGQNLFNVYSTRSYQAEVECMGNAMIQPMMYFQLNNIPMFRGGYLITRVKHTIRPNTMSTSFRGVRVSRINTPLIKEGDLYMNLLGSYSDIDGSSVKIQKSNSEWLIKARDIDSEKLGTLMNLGKPLNGTNIIRSNFGERNGKQHQGIDIRASVGTEILGLGTGTLESIRLQSSGDGGFGLYIITKYVIKNVNWYALYAHLDSISPDILMSLYGVKTLSELSDSDNSKLTSSGLSMSEPIKKDMVLGTTGGSSKNSNNVNGYYFRGRSTEPHLHFEIREENSDNKSTDIISTYFNNTQLRDPAQILRLDNYDKDTDISKPKET